MNKTLKAKKIVTADEIAEMADCGEDISPFFTGKGKMVEPLQQVNVDFAAVMPDELDRRSEPNIGCGQALLRQTRNQRWLAAAK